VRLLWRANLLFSTASIAFIKRVVLLTELAPYAAARHAPSFYSEVIATDDPDRIQDLQGRIGALHGALEGCLSQLSECYGNEARQKIETLRAELVSRFKYSGIPAEREMDHAKVVRPAIEVLQTVFDGAIERLKS
jgi:hypothetical protein